MQNPPRMVCYERDGLLSQWHAATGELVAALSELMDVLPPPDGRSRTEREQLDHLIAHTAADKRVRLARAAADAAQRAYEDHIAEHGYGNGNAAQRTIRFVNPRPIGLF